MNQIKLFLSIIIFVLSSFVKNNFVQKFQGHSLIGFSNYTGRGVTAQFIQDFTQFANQGSTFYLQDINANLKYIKGNMDNKYGSTQYNFFVMIQTKTGKSSNFLWITNENIIAQRSGINKKYSMWSYLIYRVKAPKTSPQYITILPGKQSKKISDYSDLIKKVVNQYQSGSLCSCNQIQTKNIGQTLINGSGRTWNVVCDANGAVSGLILAKLGIWGSIKPRKCTYTLYTSQ